MTNVIVSTKRPIQISAGGTTGLVQTSTQVTLKNNPPQSAFPLEQLSNVDSAGEVNGVVLVYDSVVRKWVTKKLNLDDVQGNLDGGDF